MTGRERKLGFELMDAAMRGDQAVVDDLLLAGASPSAVLRREGWGKSTAFREATRAEQFEVALHLVAKGANVHFENEDGTNEVTFALEVYGKRLADESKRQTAFELIKELLARGAKPAPDCLLSAAGAADLKLLRLLLASGIDVNIVKESAGKLGNVLMPNGETALALAVLFGHEKVVIELLNAGANPDVVVPLKGPCINVAVANGNAVIVKALIAAKADLDRRATVSIGSFREGRVGSGEDYGKLIINTPASARDATPLIIAIRCKNKDMVRFLIEGGADVQAIDGDGLTPLAWAERVKFSEAEDLLRRSGATDANAGGSPLNQLYSAAAVGGLQKIREALACGADVNGMVERRGTTYTPLMRAARAGRCEVIKALLRAGADPNLGGRENFDGDITPLMLAARQGHDSAVQLLLDAGAKADVRIRFLIGPGKGQSAAQQAEENDYDKIARMIRIAARSQKGKAAKEMAT